jgi:hypothetical protein
MCHLSMECVVCAIHQVRLVHEGPAVVERDFQTIVGLMPTMFEGRAPE